MTQKLTAIIEARALLPTIRRLDFSSRSGAGSRCAWSGRGDGGVRVEPCDDGLRFFERGHFLLEGQARPVPFTNVYRWEWRGERLRLHHERRGADHGVWLFDLVAGDEADTLVSDDAHLCGDDRYSARLGLTHDGFTLDWRILGPRKDEVIAYRYTAA